MTRSCNDFKGSIKSQGSTSKKVQLLVICPGKRCFGWIWSMNPSDPIAHVPCPTTSYACGISCVSLLRTLFLCSLLEGFRFQGSNSGEGSELFTVSLTLIFLKNKSLGLKCKHHIRSYKKDLHHTWQPHTPPSQRKNLHFDPSPPQKTSTTTPSSPRNKTRRNYRCSCSWVVPTSVASDCPRTSRWS